MLQACFGAYQIELAFEFRREPILIAFSIVKPLLKVGVNKALFFFFPTARLFGELQKRTRREQMSSKFYNKFEKLVGDVVVSLKLN